MKFTEITKKWPANTIATSTWLISEGISRQSLAKYCQTGWVEKIDNGAYKKAGESVDWTGAIFALQRQLGLEIYPASYTALDLQGFRHHVSVSNPEIYLVGASKTALPRWFLKGDWQSKIHFRSSGILPSQLGLVDKEFRGNYQIKISSPEKAILEVMEEIIDENTFEDAANIANSLLSLQEDLIFELLSSCKSRRTKRLFLFLAKHSGLPVYQALRHRKIDIGKGILQVVSGGKFIKEFGITVPSSFKDEGGNPF